MASKIKTAKCLVGCIEKFSCNQPLEKPTDAESVSPWVKARFNTIEGFGSEIIRDEIITVGNESSKNMPSLFGVSKDANHAAIKSFEFGATDGVQCTLEIVDEEGGAFFYFVKRLIKCMDETSSKFDFQVQWGWSRTLAADGSSSPIASPVVTFIPRDLKIDFSSGVIKYTITGSDTFQVAFAARGTESFGTSENPMALKDAIQKLLTETEPKCDVEYLRKTPDGSTDTWEYSKASGGKDNKDNKDSGRGPLGSWKSDNQNKLATLMKWNEAYRTDADKGITPRWDTLSATPKVVLWEDTSLSCTDQATCDNPYLHVGAFIVNGGNCSNVISFTPTINWPAGFAMLAQGGAAGGSATVETVRNTNERAGVGDCKVQKDTNAGSTVATTPDNNAENAYGSKNVLEETTKSQNAQSQANIGRQGIQPIEGELKLQGNPDIRFVSSFFIQSAYASIIVINPFHISDTADGLAKDWRFLADSACNSVLSNRFWKVLGVNHSIKEGSYVTTLKVNLPVPGIELAPYQALGTDNLSYNPSQSDSDASGSRGPC